MFHVKRRQPTEKFSTLKAVPRRLGCRSGSTSTWALDERLVRRVSVRPRDQRVVAPAFDLDRRHGRLSWVQLESHFHGRKIGGRSPCTRDERILSYGICGPIFSLYNWAPFRSRMCTGLSIHARRFAPRKYRMPFIAPTFRAPCGRIGPFPLLSVPGA